MQRREVLRLLATGTALQLAPGKLFALVREVRTLIDNQPSPRTLNPHQFATVTTMAELIIPRTDTPGATDVKTADFIDLILTEWFDASERDHFLTGLGDVDARSQSLFSKSFVDCSPLEQADILTALGEKMAETLGPPGVSMRLRRRSPAARDFYATFRQLTLTAYYTSEAGATSELHFEIIPGEYEGCKEETPIKQEPQK